MGSKYEITPYDYENGGWQETITCDTWEEAQVVLGELSKKYYCVRMEVRTQKRGLI